MMNPARNAAYPMPLIPGYPIVHLPLHAYNVQVGSTNIIHPTNGLPVQSIRMVTPPPPLRLPIRPPLRRTNMPVGSALYPNAVPFYPQELPTGCRDFMVKCAQETNQLMSNFNSHQHNLALDTLHRAISAKQTEIQQVKQRMQALEETKAREDIQELAQAAMAAKAQEASVLNERHRISQAYSTAKKIIVKNREMRYVLGASFCPSPDVKGLLQVVDDSRDAHTFDAKTRHFYMKKVLEFVNQLVLAAIPRRVGSDSGWSDRYQSSYTIQHYLFKMHSYGASIVVSTPQGVLQVDVKMTKYLLKKIFSDVSEVLSQAESVGFESMRATELKIFQKCVANVVNNISNFNTFSRL
jgi:hypothetical protein